MINVDDLKPISCIHRSSPIAKRLRHLSNKYENAVVDIAKCVIWFKINCQMDRAEIFEILNEWVEPSFDRKVLWELSI